MKTTAIVLLPAFLLVEFFAAKMVTHVASPDGFNVLQWCLIILVGLIVCLLVNLAIFAPIYWLIGKLHSKRSEGSSGKQGR